MNRLERYESRTAAPLTGLAVVFLLVYGAPIVWPSLPAWLVITFEVSNVAIWLAFAVDLMVRVALAPQRLRYVARHPVDVLTVALPMLRPLRVLRVFTAGQLLLTRGRGLLQTGQAVIFAASLLVVIGALAILDAERAVDDANIQTFPDALWWAMTTVTTVGYGDLFPVTGLGRAVAAALMLVGISLLGIVTATVAAWFMRAGEESGGPAPTAATRMAELKALRDEGHIDEAEYRRARRQVLEGVTGFTDRRLDPGP